MFVVLVLFSLETPKGNSLYYRANRIQNILLVLCIIYRFLGGTVKATENMASTLRKIKIRLFCLFEKQVVDRPSLV